MSRAKTQAPEPLAPSLEHMLPAEAAQLGQDMTAMRLTLETADTLFGDGMAFDEGRVANQIRAQTQLMGDCGIQIGSYFNWAKAHVGHGSFGRFVQSTGYSERSARVFMGLAHAFLQKNGQPIPLLQYLRDQQPRDNQAKLIELTTLNADQLEKLGDGEEIFGLDRDAIALMTAKELRDALRAAAEEKSADQTLIDQKDERINKLQRALTKAQRGGVEFEEHAYAETLKEVQEQAASFVASARQALAALAALSETLTMVQVPAHLEKLIKRDVAMGLCADTFRLGERVAEMILEQQSTFAEFLGGDRGDLDGVLTGGAQ